MNPNGGTRPTRAFCPRSRDLFFEQSKKTWSDQWRFPNSLAVFNPGPVCTENLNPHVMVLKSSKDRA